MLCGKVRRGRMWVYERGGENESIVKLGGTVPDGPWLPRVTGSRVTGCKPTHIWVLFLGVSLFTV